MVAETNAVRYPEAVTAKDGSKQGRRALTQAVREAASGSQRAIDRLYEACYPELRRLAHQCLRAERPNHTLQTTEVVHESYTRLVDASKLDVRDRAHFCAIASRVMRYVLVDYARGRNAAKRGGKSRAVTLSGAFGLKHDPPDFDLLALHLALSRLETEKPQHARVIEMHYFGGMTYEEIALFLGVATATVKRHANYGRARLYELIEGTE